MTRHELERPHEQRARPRDVSRGHEHGERDKFVGGLALSLERLEDLRLQLARVDVVGRVREQALEMPKRVLVHLVLDVDADLDEHLLDRRGVDGLSDGLAGRGRLDARDRDRVLDSLEGRRLLLGGRGLLGLV